MTCPSHTTSEHYHTALPPIVQSIAQTAHEACAARLFSHTLRVGLNRETSMVLI